VVVVSHVEDDDVKVVANAWDTAVDGDHVMGGDLETVA
jgi:hypothetical protein